MDVKEIARKWALQNAAKYDGKASQGAVISKVLGERPELKAEMREAAKVIAEVIKEVNAIPVEEQLSELKDKYPELLEARKEEPALKSLPQAEERKVVMRFAPSPSGPLHIGHAIVLSLNALYCEKYKGRLVLRLEDTNPENIYNPAYHMIPEDAKWLAEIFDVVVQSERLGRYYDVAEQLVREGNAYVCTCNPDVWRTLSRDSEACPCRGLSSEEQSKRWAGMFSSYKPGEAVLRIKTDISHPNPAMRDWPGMRINDHPHPKTGTDHRVWPLMNFSVTVDDHDFHITHSIRGKDHVDNEKRQRFMYGYLGWEPPVAQFIGRINFPDFNLSSTEARLAVERGEYDGWDDPRLPFLAAFRRRGYQPGAFKRFAFEMGVSLADKTVSADEFFKLLDAFNKDIIDPVADRHFFVKHPVKIHVEGAPSFKVELKLHPDKDSGVRVLEAGADVLVSQEDLDSWKEGETVRLIECMNVRRTKEGFEFVSREYEKGLRMFHWLKEGVTARLLMPDNSWHAGVAEEGVKSLSPGDVVQLERVGFARLDAVRDNVYEFVFAHR